MKPTLALVLLLAACAHPEDWHQPRQYASAQTDWVTCDKPNGDRSVATPDYCAEVGGRATPFDGIHEAMPPRPAARTVAYRDCRGPRRRLTCLAETLIEGGNHPPQQELLASERRSRERYERAW